MRHWRVRVLGWGNVLIGIAIPIGAFSNLLSVLGVFTVESADESILFMVLLGSILSYLHWMSGWAILHRCPSAFRRTYITGGLTLGYTIAGIFLMATGGRDRIFVTLLRHHSVDWWDWSFSHFQNSALREIPFMAWWVVGLGTAVRTRLPGAPARVVQRVTAGAWSVFVLTLIGAVGRGIQILSDSMLYSQR